MIDKIIIILITIIYLDCMSVYADNPQKHLAQDVYQHEMRILRNIRCLTCNGQSIAESHSEIAQDIKSYVKEQLLSGADEHKIYDSLVDVYGDQILFSPPINISTSILWGFPFILCLIGIFCVYRYHQS